MEINNIENRIMDAIDIETFFVCKTEDDGKKLMLSLMKKWGYKNVDVVFCKHESVGARVRGRIYINKPADNYGWLNDGEQL